MLNHHVTGNVSLLLYVVIALLMFATTPAHAQLDEYFKPSERTKKAPLEVTAEQMESNRATNTIIFRGSVKAIKGALRVTADVMRAFTSPDQKEFTSIDATGSVRLVHGDKTATGERAQYNQATQLIVITGNAVLIDGKNRATGEKVIYNLAKEDMRIEGGGEKGPATLILYPKEDGKGEKGVIEPTVKSTPSPATSTTDQPESTPMEKQKPVETPDDSPPPVDKKPTSKIVPGSKIVKHSSNNKEREVDEKYTLQVGAFSSKGAAARMIIDLKKKGYPVYLDPEHSGGTAIFKVRIGRFDSASEAKKMKEILSSKENVDPIVTTYTLAQ
jgi:lipopolysaccharide export system protein LptA